MTCTACSPSFAACVARSCRWMNVLPLPPLENRPTLASLKASRMIPCPRLNLTHFCR